MFVERQLNTRLGLQGDGGGGGGEDDDEDDRHFFLVCFVFPKQGVRLNAAERQRDEETQPDGRTDGRSSEGPSLPFEKRGKKHISFVYNKATFQKVVRERLFYIGGGGREWNSCSVSF